MQSNISTKTNASLVGATTMRRTASWNGVWLKRPSVSRKEPDEWERNDAATEPTGIDAYAGEDGGAYAESGMEPQESDVDFDRGESGLLQSYFRSITDKQLLTREDEVELFDAMRRGDDRARHRLIECNLRLVVSIAKGYRNRGLDFLDLIEEGNLGMMHALDKFDVTRGCRFAGYASWWIRQSVEAAIMSQSRTIRLPNNVVKELSSVLRAGRRLESVNGSAPTLDQVAESLARPVDRVRQLLRYGETEVSLDMGGETDADKSLIDTLADAEEYTPDNQVQFVQASQCLRGLLAELPERHVMVLTRRYGLDGEEAGTLDEVAAMLGLSRERTRRIANDALYKLKKLINAKGLRFEEFL